MGAAVCEMATQKTTTMLTTTVLIFALSLTVTTGNPNIEGTGGNERRNKKFSCGSRGEFEPPAEQKLLCRLFRFYDKNVRPVYNATKSVNVTFGISLIQIMDMDERNQRLVTNVWLEHGWVDERLRWTPRQYGGIVAVRVPPNRIWLPDIVLYNNADDYTSGYMPSNVVVSHDGSLFWSPPARMRSSCIVNITYFPFDSQQCIMKFGSWTYDQAQVDIVQRSDQIDLTNYVTNGEWELLEARVIRNEIVYPIGDEVYPDVTIVMKMRRRILFYLLNIIAPCVFFNILSMLSFQLPCDCGEKVTLGITVLLSYSVFMLLIAESLPPTSEYLPLISIYLTVSMAITSVSVVMTVCILKLHHCGPDRPDVPDWIRTHVLKSLASLLRCKPCWRGTSFQSLWKAKQAGTTRRRTEELEEVCMKLVQCNDHTSGNHVIGAKLATWNPRALNMMAPGPNNVAGVSAGDTSSLTTPHSILHQNSAFTSSKQPMGYIPRLATMESLSDVTYSEAATNASMMCARKHAIMEEILAYLKLMVARSDEQDAKMDKVSEWQEAAHVIDSLLFYVFLVAVSISTLTLVVFIPYIQYSSEDAIA